MNWEAIGAIGEIVGAIAVVATLGYLAVQVRQNNRFIRGSTISAITQQQQFELHWSSESAMRKVIENPEDLTEDEIWKVSELFTASLLARQNEYFQYTQGLLLEGNWQASKKIINVTFGTKWSRNWYETYGRESIIDVFSTEVDGILATSEFDMNKVLSGINGTSGDVDTQHEV